MNALWLAGIALFWYRLGFCLVSQYMVAWWRHQMETFSSLLALCAGNSPVTSEFPRTKASDAELWCFLWSAPWINGWVNTREAGDLRRHRAHYGVIVMGSHDRREYPPVFRCHSPFPSRAPEPQRRKGTVKYSRLIRYLWSEPSQLFIR